MEQPGTYPLLCRATSAAGETQPEEHDPFHGGYVIHFVHPHPVRVAARGRTRETWGDAASRLADMEAQVTEMAQRRLDVEIEYDFRQQEWWCNFCGYKTTDRAAYLGHSCVEELRKQGRDPAAGGQ